MKIYSSISSNLEQEFHNFGLWYIASFILGIVFFFQSNDSFYLKGACVASGILATLIISYNFIRLRNVISIFFTLSISFFLVGYLVANIRVIQKADSSILEQVVANIEGNITSIKPAKRGTQVTLENTRVDNKNFGKVRINIAKKFDTNLQHGDYVTLRAKLFPLSSRIMPDSFDFGFYLSLSGIQATGYALSPLKVMAKKTTNFDGFIQNIRTNIYSRLIQVLGQREGNFAAAILIGETKAIPDDISQNMRNTGVAHILSVSGLHLSLVAMLFFITSRAMLNASNYIAYNFNVKLLASIISIVASFLYLHISGANIAATRAFIMTSVFILASMTDRSSSPLRSLFVAAFLILLFLPEYVLHPSFQLSFTAVLCLISGYEFYLKNKHILGKSKGIFASIKLYVFANIYSSSVASIMTAPYVIYHFYKFANYSVLMNLIAVPIMSFFLMPFTIIATVLMPFGLDSIFLWVLGFFIRIIIDCANYISSLPGAIWYFGHITPASLLIYTMGFFWLALWQTRWRRFGLLVIIFSVVLMLLSPKPIMVVDLQDKILGIRTKQGKLDIYSEKSIPRFTREYWANWFGIDESLITHNTESIEQKLFNLRNNKTLAIINNQCLEADLIIPISDNVSCDNNNILVNYKSILSTKFIEVFCNNKKCWVQVVNDH